MRIQSPRGVVTRFFDAVNNHEVPEQARELFGERIELEGPGGLRLKGPEQVAEFFRTYAEAFPDANSDTEEMVVSGSTVITEGTFTGTHRGRLRLSPGLELEPQGARARIRHVHIIIVRRGVIVEIQFYMDRLELREQLAAA